MNTRPHSQTASILKRFGQESIQPVYKQMNAVDVVKNEVTVVNIWKVNQLLYGGLL